MPQTKNKPKSARRPQSKNGEKPEAASDVLTLNEAAAYLRLPEEEVVRLVQYQGLPGRQTNTGWRFLKSALQDWLSVPPPKPSKEAVLSRIGNWKDDPYVDQELKEIYERRGQAMNGDES
jgi:excisionase family DNA binding protein